jgi:hypothetical protein
LSIFTNISVGSELITNNIAHGDFGAIVDGKEMYVSNGKKNALANGNFARVGKEALGYTFFYVFCL